MNIAKKNDRVEISWINLAEKSKFLTWLLGEQTIAYEEYFVPISSNHRLTYKDIKDSPKLHSQMYDIRDYIFDNIDEWVCFTNPDTGLNVVAHAEDISVSVIDDSAFPNVRFTCNRFYDLPSDATIIEALITSKLVLPEHPRE